MPLNIDIHLRNNPPAQPTTTVLLAGSLDTATAPSLEQQLKPVLDGPSLELIFDLAKLEFISSAGLRVFALARKRIRDKGGQVSFVHLPPQIQKVFDIVAALPGMQVFRDQEEMDAYLARRQQMGRRSG